MNTKILLNQLRIENLERLSRTEKHDIVIGLLSTLKISQRELAKKIGVPYSTLHDWVSLRQDNKGVGVHMSFHAIIRKLKAITNDSVFNDFGRIEEIKEICEEILQQKK
jgi:transposase-like protein